MMACSGKGTVCLKVPPETGSFLGGGPWGAELDIAANIGGWHCFGPGARRLGKVPVGAVVRAVRRA